LYLGLNVAGVDEIVRQAQVRDAIITPAASVKILNHDKSTLGISQQA
jgi:hypothetical protein